MSNALGIFADGILPGIKTADKAADDVLQERLDIAYKDKKIDAQIAFLNSKGFGGNNATAVVLSPKIAESMMANRYGEEKMAGYHERREGVRKAAAIYDKNATNGALNVIYHFGTGIINEDELVIDDEKLSIAELSNSVNLDIENPYEDMV